MATSPFQHDWWDFMPADYTIDAARQFVYSRGWGDLTDADSLDYGPGARRAIVAPDVAVFGLARMFESHRDAGGGEEQIRVFKSLEDAWAWLGISPMGA